MVQFHLVKIHIWINFGYLSYSAHRFIVLGACDDLCKLNKEISNKKKRFDYAKQSKNQYLIKKFRQRV